MTNPISHPFQTNEEWQKLQDGIIALAKKEVLTIANANVKIDAGVANLIRVSLSMMV